MSILMKIACRVIARRKASGEAFEDIMKDYPLMTADQVNEVRKELDINENLD
ncbi:antitoxin [Clostridium minihomine]|uniref:antitoxin n=1 Tax=Clostridium minihomine TaxID=2045012 RepID=UPI000C75CD83|nr:antitoxin [Clostridium minihomine]